MREKDKSLDGERSYKNVRKEESKKQKSAPAKKGFRPRKKKEPVELVVCIGCGRHGFLDIKDPHDELSFFELEQCHLFAWSEPKPELGVYCSVRCADKKRHNLK